MSSITLLREIHETNLLLQWWNRELTQIFGMIGRLTTLLLTDRTTLSDPEISFREDQINLYLTQFHNIYRKIDLLSDRKKTLEKDLIFPQ